MIFKCFSNHFCSDSSNVSLKFCGNCLYNALSQSLRFLSISGFWQKIQMSADFRMIFGLSLAFLDINAKFVSLGSNFGQNLEQMRFSAKFRLTSRFFRDFKEND